MQQKSRQNGSPRPHHRPKLLRPQRNPQLAQGALPHLRRSLRLAHPVPQLKTYSQDRQANLLQNQAYDLLG